MGSSGYGDTCTFFFEGIAKHIAAAGYAVYAIDHSGFGLSDGAIALKALLKEPREWDGIVLVAPMCKYINLTFKMAKSGCISLSAIISFSCLGQLAFFPFHQHFGKVRVETIEVWAALFGAEIINDKTKKSHVLATASVGSATASRSSSLSPCCLRFVSSFVDNNNNIDPRVKLTFVSCF
ncbi:hypothetical protein FXO38_06979 [Capsicum annuum]|nr:hypothetical protein FXO38_06979 [Capsicum annuum]KAF3673540.1 hypothetical protein FXO37_06925 [Capsicum annuum]